MMAGNVIAAYSAQVLVIAAAAGLALKVFRISNPKARLFLYQAVLGACVALPIMERWMPREETTGLVTATIANWKSASTAASPVFSFHFSSWIVWLVAGGALLRFAWMCCGLLRLKQVRTGSVCVAEKTEGPTSIYISEHIGGPATYGFFRPVILLPKEMRFNQTVLRHELIHVKRADWLWRMVEEFILCLLWFHPAIWWLKSQIELAREQVVDSETVSQTGAPGEYVNALIEVASAQMRRQPVLASEFLGKGSLKQRVKMLLTPAQESRRKLACSIAICIASLALAGWQSARALPLYAADAGDADSPANHNDQKTTDKQQGTTSEPVKTVRVGGEAQEKNLIKKVTPKYPTEAKAKRIQGKVVLDVTISPEGHVTSVTPVSGPAELIQSAVDAVKQWEYRPTLLNGEPVEVQSTVLVNYTLLK